MLKKREGFEGQRAIILPRKILAKYCCVNPLIAGVYITDIGYYPKAKYHYRERLHGCDQDILIYCQEGTGWAKINDEEYKIEQGNFFIIPSGLPHTYAADERSPWTIYWAHFKGTNTRSIINNFLEQNGNYCGYVDYLESRIRLFEEMYSNLEMGYSNDKLCYANMCLPHFLSSFIFKENYNLSTRKQSKNQINQSINYMKQYIDKMLSLQQMAASVNLSASHFSFVFKKNTGFPPIEYFNHLKVQKACQYLLFTDLRVKEIANNLGIEDPYYFSRMFTKVIGVSPGEYRAKGIS
ncbi:MAG: AraC family transcriptional regulator [Chitinophagaceae bacterium]